jgi:hypothetical protein
VCVLTDLVVSKVLGVLGEYEEMPTLVRAAAVNAIAAIARAGNLGDQVSCLLEQARCVCVCVCVCTVSLPFPWHHSSFLLLPTVLQACHVVHALCRTLKFEKELTKECLEALAVSEPSSHFRYLFYFLPFCRPLSVFTFLSFLPSLVSLSLSLSLSLSHCPSARCRAILAAAAHAGPGRHAVSDRGRDGRAATPLAARADQRPR